ncbi:MAG: putative lipid II flippase FtsW [Spirochaetales bacterium]|nr:putative lipid II flippase FtsW [Spirochaetales bacterium]
MSDRFTLERVPERPGCDFVLLIIVVLLAGIGIVSLFSASYYNADVFQGDSLYFLKKQAVFLVIGVVAFFVSSRVSLSWVQKNIPLFLLLSFLLLCATFVPGIGKKVMGATRWIRFGSFSFQPSELAKLVILLYLASIFSKKEERIHETGNVVLPPLLVTVLFVSIIFYQNDFSTAVFVFLLSMTMFFMANVKMVYFILIGTFTIPLAGIMLFTREHRVKRLISFLEPEMDPAGTGYQIIASQSALSNGGVWGTGFGRGIKKLGGLPMVDSDFVFASMGEEAGFLGITIIILLFILFAFRGYWISTSSGDRFGYYLGFGITTAILYQAFFNMAVVVGLVPATGIPLPFFSSGGSSLLVTFIMCGLLLNISRNRNSEYFSKRSTELGGEVLL